jgi:hypothetical protein
LIMSDKKEKEKKKEKRMEIRKIGHGRTEEE